MTESKIKAQDDISQSDLRVSVANIIRVWSDPTDAPESQSVRVAWLMQMWPELGKALQALHEVEYRPLMTQSELDYYIKNEFLGLVNKTYPESERIDEIGRHNAFSDAMQTLQFVADVAGDNAPTNGPTNQENTSSS